MEIGGEKKKLGRPSDSFIFENVQVEIGLIKLPNVSDCPRIRCEKSLSHSVQVVL